MDLRKLMAVALVAGMVAGSLTTADAAKRKKKKKLVSKTATFFLRNTSECDISALSLSFTDGEDTDCIHENNAVGSALGYEPHVYTAAEGVPFLLDAKKNVTGVVTMRNGNSVGAGEGGVLITLSGELGGEEQEIGTWEADPAQIIPGGAHVHDFDIEVDDALHAKKFTSLKLTVMPTGTTAGLYGTVEHDGPPPATLNLPTLKKK